MTNIIMQQITKQVKKAMEAAKSARPLPALEYMPTTDCEPSHKHAPITSHRPSDEVREAARPDRDGRSYSENRDQSSGCPTKPSAEPGVTSEVNYGLDAIRNSFLMHCLVPEVKKHQMLKRPRLITTAPKLHNVQKYYEFHKHTTTECRELRKTLYELAEQRTD
ncbi:LOW QUALITY PROTEIN: hypothetical protein Cgig2_027408 [Carnegiea gigantea]|uniref:Uncharacterized protein n=1 Tax=Carnegiea gigantea TaxID=171969 RepID=A0A9Q1Q7I5_9CARY|nr:LOW QUALITY PROTEIN: hypothetical protein Cgig2_027408 [Carnegiea gigantea]